MCNWDWAENPVKYFKISLCCWFMAWNLFVAAGWFYVLVHPFFDTISCFYDASFTLLLHVPSAASPSILHPVFIIHFFIIHFFTIHFFALPQFLTPHCHIALLANMPLSCYFLYVMPSILYRADLESYSIIKSCSTESVP